MGKEPLEQSKQVSRFLETARQLGCDEDEATFNEKLKAIAKANPKPRTVKKEGS